VSHSKDDINILKGAVIEKIGVGLRRIADGCHFIVTSIEVGKLIFRFDESEEQEGELICNVPCELFVNGDLKYLLSFLAGKEYLAHGACGVRATQVNGSIICSQKTYGPLIFKPNLS
jgi:hypothetical protein